MTKANQWTARLLTLPLAFALCGLDRAALAQAAPQDNNVQTPNANGQPSRPGMVDPSQGPLQPVPAPDQTVPEAPNPQTAPPESAPSSTGSQQPPAGAAVGQSGATAGGAASRPAGAAIAPAEQHHYRSLLIKIGAIAAAGVALGAVIALSKGSPSNPPGAH